MNDKRRRRVEIFKVSISGPDTRFSAAHFLVGKRTREGVHGHNYEVEVVVEGDLNEDYMVIDFRELRRIVREICRELDHKILLPGKSKLVLVEERESQVHVTIADEPERRYVFPKQDVKILPIEASTAELLAKYIAERLMARLGTHRNINRIVVRVSEAPGSTATYTVFLQNTSSRD